jgi:hypothetical protein
MSAPETCTPSPGDLVHDRRVNRIGVLMDSIGGKLYLRPVGGGIEWTVDPRHAARPVSPPASAERRLE